MAVQPATMLLSLSEVPIAERSTVLREMIGPSLNMDFKIQSETIEFEATCLMLPQVAITNARNSGLFAKRLDLSLENDDFALAWPASPVKGRMQHLAGEVDGESGQAVLMSCADQFTAAMEHGFQPVTLRIGRALLMPLLPHAEAALMRPITADQPAFQLLRTYLDVLWRDDTLRSPDVVRAAVAHIADLVALAVGTTRDAGALAAGRGLRAARLEAVKQWTLDRLHWPGLSIGDAAAAQRVSPRYVQMLFETNDLTFSKFLLQQRLAFAHRLLGNATLAARQISAIAFDAGFGDLSYFNRTFRAAFGETPSDFRRRATNDADRDQVGSPRDK